VDKGQPFARLTDYIPAWRETEAEYERQRQEAIENETKATEAKKINVQSAEKKISDAQPLPEQQSLFPANQDGNSGKKKSGTHSGGEATEERFTPADSSQLLADDFVGNLFDQNRLHRENDNSRE